MRVVDPACGSGAFLISAFRRVLEGADRGSSRLRPARRAATRRRDRRDAAHRRHPGATTSMASTSTRPRSRSPNSPFGCIRPAPIAPLSALDHTLRCGNSLVAHDFWAGRADDRRPRERVNSFDWTEAFPEVLADPTDGRLRHRPGQPALCEAAEPDEGRSATSSPICRPSAATTPIAAPGPGISISICPSSKRVCGCSRPGGRMAYIAPSLWVVNAYGAACAD